MITGYKQIDRQNAEIETDEVNKKRDVKNAIMTIQAKFGLKKGKLSVECKKYIQLIGNQVVMEGLQEELVDLIGQWRDNDISGWQGSNLNRPLRFYYFLQRGRLDEEDKEVMKMYFEQLHPFPSIVHDIPVSKFRGLGVYFFDKMEYWLGNKSGNGLNSATLEYLKEVFKRAAEFRIGILSNPATIFGKYGWNLWIQYISEKYGSRDHYLLPTDDELEDRKEMENMIERVRVVSAGFFSIGQVEKADQLQRAISKSGSVDELKQLLNEIGVEQ